MMERMLARQREQPKVRKIKEDAEAKTRHRQLKEDIEVHMKATITSVQPDLW
jgi:hypothetical protein